MALQPTNYSTQERLSPGSRGEKFIQNMPGYRTNETRINRTNNNLSATDHDLPVVKYEIDDRLKVLFRYGFAYGYNQIVITKGRVAAADPYMDLINSESQKQFNVATIANGGVPVKVRTANDKYKDPGSSATSMFSAECAGGNKVLASTSLEWAPLNTIAKSYTLDCYRPFVDNTATVEPGATAKVLTQAELLGTYTIDTSTDQLSTGRIKDATGAVTADVRPGNIPLGIFSRNEYTRDFDAANGYMLGPIYTDKLVELPYFAYKDKAEENVWGSAYGVLQPGDLIKSDENGRLVKSPLSSETALSTMGVAELEKERQQVVGQVYCVNMNMLPEGSAKWATWALEDRLNYEGFYPDEYRRTNRNGEDNISQSPHNSTSRYPGYPYDSAYTENDLQMMSGTDNFDPRMNPEYQYSELGIPGLTDGYNAVVREMPEDKLGVIKYRGSADSYVENFFRCAETNLEPSDIQIKFGNSAYTNCTAGAVISVNANAKEFKIKYFNAEQGIVTVVVNDQAAADTLLQSDTYKNGIPITMKYKKRGLSGVPTWMDWDGCVGSVKVLLQK